MTEVFQAKHKWCALRVVVQGVFEDGRCVAVKVLDDLGEPLSWAFPDPDDPKNGKNGNPPDNYTQFKRLIQKLYDESKETETN